MVGLNPVSSYTKDVKNIYIPLLFSEGTHTREITELFHEILILNFPFNTQLLQ